MKKLSLILALLALAFGALAVSGCGDKKKDVTVTGANGKKTTTQVPDIKLAKTKFVLNTGLAIGAFHRYIYKPFKAKGFAKGAPKRKRTIAKAAVAGLFVYNRLKAARDDALSSDKLRPLALKLTGLTTKLKDLASKLKSGSFNPAAILGANGALGALTGQSKGLGATIKEHVPGL